MRTFNIKFPLQESKRNLFLEMSETSNAHIKSQLALFMMTRKGSVRYKPNFGTNLSGYLFEPLDDETQRSIKNELTEDVKNSFSTISLTGIVFKSDQSQQFIGMDVTFDITDGVLKQQDSLSLSF